MVKLVTVAEVPAVVAVCPPEEVTVYPVMAEPPSLVGAFHDTVTWVSPAVPLTLVGAPGAPIGGSAYAGEATDSNPMASSSVVKPANIFFRWGPRAWRRPEKKERRAATLMLRGE